MDSVSQLLSQSALEVHARASSARLVGLEPDELEQLALRLTQAAKLDPERAKASLQMLARLFGDQRDIWQGISPSFVRLMDTINVAGSDN